MSANLKLVKPTDPDEPIDTYLNQVNSGTPDAHPYERLMIWYRKLKQYKDEIAIIDKGITQLKKFYAKQQKESLGKRISPSIKALSAKINKTTGLYDKKGNEIYLPDPLPKWIKRKEVAEQKLKKQQAKKKPRK